jgi:hypothetical protein
VPPSPAPPTPPETSTRRRTRPRPCCVACSCEVKRLGTSAQPCRHHFGYLSSPPSDPTHPRLDPVRRRHLISTPPTPPPRIIVLCTAWAPGLCIFEGESIREWLFFDNPRRAFDGGNCSNGPLLIVKGCANAILMDLDIYTVLQESE